MNRLAMLDRLTKVALGMRAYRSRRRRCAAVYLLELNTDEIGTLDPREAVADGRVIRAIDPRPINMKE